MSSAYSFMYIHFKYVCVYLQIKQCCYFASMVKHNLEKIKKNNLCILIFLLVCCCLFLPDILGFLHRLLFQGPPLVILLEKAYYQILFVFPSSYHVLISCALLKDCFAGCRILGWWCFTFSTWKTLCHFSEALIVSDEKFPIVWIVFPSR